MCELIFLLLQVDCRKNSTFELPAEKHLARIEVFNSLAVSAPQIEIDRLQRRDKNYEGRRAMLLLYNKKGKPVLFLDCSTWVDCSM